MTTHAEKEFYYRDNWVRDVHKFATLEEARKEAKKEWGDSIDIYGRYGLIETVKASGTIYP